MVRAPDRCLLHGALAATLGMLVMAWYLKAPCRDVATWTSKRHWRLGCYSDIWPLYASRRLHDQWPYLEAFNEYPPVTAAWQALLGRVAVDAGHFWELNAILLGVLALATTAVLVRAGVGAQIWGWALAPPVIFYSFHNWDLLAILPATAGTVMWMRGRVGWGGALIALAACAKWYPGILLPILGMELIRRERGLGPQGWRFGLAAVGVLTAVNLPTYLLTPDGFLAPYGFHAGRSAAYESHWFALRHYAGHWDLPVAPIIAQAAGHGLAFVLTLAAGLAIAVWRGWLEVRAAAALGIVGWLVVSPVLSMQYALWILPPLLLAGLPARRLIPFLVADLLVFIAVWRFFERAHGPAADHEPLAVASILRMLALLGLCAWLVRAGRAGSPMARRDGEPEDASAGPVEG